MLTRTVQQVVMWLAALAFLSACSPIAAFSQPAYEQATSMKVEALAIMERATEPYVDHGQSVEALKINAEKAHEYARGRPENEETAQLREIIEDPSRNPLGGSLGRWEREGTLGVIFIQEAKCIVSDGFDAVIELGSGKRKTP
jgi:hypothetical protein